MKSKSLENLLGEESGLHSDMVTRFQKLRDSSLLSRARGRNAEFLDADEIVSGVLSVVATKPGFAAMTAIGLRKLRPVGLPEDAFAGAPILAGALKAILEDPLLLAAVKEIRLGDSDPGAGMATSASISYVEGGQERVSYYVSDTAVSLFHKGKEREFDRRTRGFSIARETVLAPRLLGRIVREMRRAREIKALESQRAE